MTDEFEKALHRALRPRHPREDLSDRIVARLDSHEVPPAPAARLHSPEVPLAPAARVYAMRRRVFRAFHSRWLPAALAACLIAGFGVFQMRQHALDAARANQARAQLLEALSIASRNINIVRAAVAREEHPDS